MKKAMLGGLVVVSMMAGAAQAAPSAKKGIRVVSSAKVLSVAEKAGVSGMHGDCGCPDPVTKPGYGFGAKVEHYGPPGQGFNPYWTWRRQMEDSDYTPKGNALPPQAFVVNPR